VKEWVGDDGDFVPDQPAVQEFSFSLGHHAIRDGALAKTNERIDLPFCYISAAKSDELVTFSGLGSASHVPFLLAFNR